VVSTNGKATRWLPDFGRRQERGAPEHTWGQTLYYVNRKGEQVSGVVVGIHLEGVHLDCPGCHCVGTWHYAVQCADGSTLFDAEDQFTVEP
jgi:hypothetical protein